MTTLMNTKSKSNTGCKGVFERRGKYEAHITVKGKNTPIWYKVHVGIYPTLTEAIAARLNYIQSLA